MATLVLTVAGGGIGGPIGAAIGGAIGNAFDHEVLFKPPGREGPRLSDLRIQTSSYGTQIPKLFGTMRVAGTVIWATDLIEHRSTDGGGKGRPSTTRYSYTASFAVALSSRQVRRVRRIWAEGQLLRGAAGDFKARCGFRLHMGDEDQAPDPLIAAAEGVGHAPAHRGLAYAVFEDLELADYGNRIPALTFEVEADSEPVPVAMVAEAVAEGSVAGERAGLLLAGFAAQGASRRAVLETLAGAAGGWFAPEGDGLILRHGPGAATDIGDTGAGQGTRGERAIASAATAARTVLLSHFDPARDYQIGVQRASRPGAGNREARVELPAAVDAGTARGLADAALARMDIERERRRVTLDWSALDLGPGMRVTIDGAPGQWRVTECSFEGMALALDCVAVAPASRPAVASAGRIAATPDTALGETRLVAFELPPLEGAPAASPRLAIAAAGTSPGWRGAALLLSTDSGARWSAAGEVTQASIVGKLTAPPPPSGSALEDRHGWLDVALAHEGMSLSGADADGLAAGANLAIAGKELLQFGRAEPLGGARWRLSMLWRGRRGTEAAAGGQSVGDGFALIDPAALAVIDLPASALGATARLLGQGRGDSVAVPASALVSGISVRPPAPVHLTCDSPGADGSATVRWTRRSRTGWDWLDGVDAPLGEEAEAYTVTIESAAGIRSEQATVPRCVLRAAERVGGATVSVRQIGSVAASQPATITIPAIGESR